MSTWLRTPTTPSVCDDEPLQAVVRDHPEAFPDGPVSEEQVEAQRLLLANVPGHVEELCPFWLQPRDERVLWRTPEVVRLEVAAAVERAESLEVARRTMLLLFGDPDSPEKDIESIIRRWDEDTTWHDRPRDNDLEEYLLSIDVPIEVLADAAARRGYRPSPEFWVPSWSGSRRRRRTAT